jgi:hypothetical protein
MDLDHCTLLEFIKNQFKNQYGGQVLPINFGFFVGALAKPAPTRPRYVLDRALR